MGHAYVKPHFIGLNRQEIIYVYFIAATSELIPARPVSEVARSEPGSDYSAFCFLYIWEEFYL